MFTALRPLLRHALAALLWPYRALRHECGVLFHHNQHTVIEVTDDVLQGAQSVAQVVVTISNELLPILIDMDAALTAAKSVSGVIEAMVPGAAQAIALATVAVDGGEALTKGANTVATIVITATSDAEKLLGIAEEVKQAVKSVVPGAVVSVNPVSPPDAPASDASPAAATDAAAPIAVVTTTATVTLPASPPALN